MAGQEKRIDTHVHAVPPSYRQALTEAALGPRIRIPDWSPEMAIAMMDRHQISASVLSLSVPGAHLGDDNKARALARRCNEEFAEIAERNPGRLGAFATLTLPDVEGACREAEYALDVLRLDGIGLLASYGELYLGDPRFDPLLETLNERSAVVHIHPNNHPSTQSVKLNVPNFLMEYLFDTTRAAVNLVFSSALDRFPNIKFILSHAGGTVPYIAWRLSEIATRQLQVAPFNEHYSVPLVKANEGHLSFEDVTSRLRRFYYDTALAAGPQTFGALREVADPDRILFGSDWPYCSEPMVDDMKRALDETAGCSRADMTAIEHGNAARLFPRLS